MGEVIFAMIAAIVGSVMVFLTILALFYCFAWIAIQAIRKLQKEWNKKEEQ